ncbi:extracellular solute-binding protein [Frigoribacterium faeni]|uniref:Carbohydrate-binding protein n=1 Tax=Frigoribacterium faeni TaxID=145483 RepID=A0A7W3JIR4_9MICO|nr:extracellular solute-binding protein [Frigoribacterium faeni]MBA8813617.1 multiple sugar transport system substrate-binding protein [Frigoribacterium faeni]GEK83931.1 carbohydrate-binding protein [Frigoribacterium faeni]
MTPPPPPSRPGLSRRNLLVGGAALLGGAFAVGGLAGCSTVGGATGAGGVAPLDFWHLLSGGDGVKMSTLVDQANAENPEFHATQTVLAWGTPYYTKLAMASAGGRAPDVAIMHASRVPGYAPGGLLDPWDVEKLASYGLREADFPPAVWQAGFSGEELYSIALDSHPFILLYNTDIAERAGVLGDDGRLVEITSPERFLEVANAMQEVTGKHGASWGYLNDGAQLWRMFYTFYKQLGAEMVLREGGTVEYDEAAAVTALEFMQRLTDGTAMATASDIQSGIAEFVSGESGMLFTGVWEVPSAQNAGIPFDASIIPTLFGTPAVYADSHAFVLPRQSTVDATTREDVYKMVSTILKDSISWAEAGHIPAYRPVVDSSAYAELRPQANYAEAADYLNYDPPAWFSGSGSDFQTYFLDTVQSVVLAKDDAAAGMRAFVDRVNTQLSRPAPV